MQRIDIFGWKGTDELSIYENVDKDYLLVEHRKEKRSGNIVEQETIVKKEYVDILWKILSRFPIGKKITYRELVAILIVIYNVPVEVDAWNGGKNRAKYYFKYHYYPLKCIEAKKLVEYDGRGNIWRLE